jgi:hypothetical protein
MQCKFIICSVVPEILKRMCERKKRIMLVTVIKMFLWFKYVMSEVIHINILLIYSKS